MSLSEEPALGGRFDSKPDEAFGGDEPGVAAGPLAPRYASHYAERRAATQPASRLLAMFLALALSGLAAVVGTFIGSPGQGVGALAIIAVITIGPTVEEVMKVAGILYLAERRPWLIPSWHWLPFIAAASGFVFAAIENLLYINVYFPDAGEEFATLRWTLGPTLHIITALIASVGVARMWSNTHDQGHPPSMAIARPFLIIAIVVHAVYNLGAVLAEAFGLI